MAPNPVFSPDTVNPDDSPRPIEIIPAFIAWHPANVPVAPQKELVHPLSLLVRILLLEDVVPDELLFETGGG